MATFYSGAQKRPRSKSWGATPLRSVIAALATAGLLLSACGNGIEQAKAEGTGNGAAPEISGNKPTKSNASDQSLDDLTYKQAIQYGVVDIQQFWTETMPEAYGQPYEAIPTSRMYPYDEANPPPPCGTEVVPYEVLRGNAFYCQIDDFIAWDDGELFPTLYEEFGPFAVTMVLAHEWGHAIQDQVGLTERNLRTVDLEQQADCFAGAWTRRLSDGDSEKLNLGSGSLDQALGGMLKFRDEPGLVSADDAGAHGSGFDRLRAFREGYTQGVDNCVDYADNPPAVLEFPFSEKEYETGGNMDINEFLDAVLIDLDEYYASVYPSFKRIGNVELVTAADGSFACGDEQVDVNDVTTGAYFCEADHKVFLSEDVLNTVNSQIGDFSVGMALALAWSAAAQLQAGTKADQIDEPEAGLQRLCLVGAYTNSWVVDRQRNDDTGEGSSIPKRQIFISGGDLDEAIQYLMAYTATDKSADAPSLAFDHTEAFERGVLEGPSACQLELD